MKFRKIVVAGLLLLLLSLAVNIGFLNFRIKAVEVAPDYIPIKWGLIVLGGFDYHHHPPGGNAIQKAEHWIQSEGVPYDIIENNKIEAPTDTATSSSYPLQYANGTTRYGVFVIILNQYSDSSTDNVDYIYWAVGNGTNAVIFGVAAKYVPELLDISDDNVSYFIDYGGITQINCTIKKTFNDGIIEYRYGTNQTINSKYQTHANISDTERKTVWYTMHSNTGKNWIGMMNTTYGSGKVFWNTVIPSYGKFLLYGTLSEYWEKTNMKFIAHAINFMFKQVKKIDIGLQGYQRWRGAITYRLDQDTSVGIEKTPEEALEKGWYVDTLICALGYMTFGWSLTDGLPEGYTGAPSAKVKHGTWYWLILTCEPLQATSRTFIVYNNSVEGNYDRVKVDWNQNYDFTDDQAFAIWENMTSNVTGLLGTHYWKYIDNWTDPTEARLGWWCPLRDRIRDFSWWKTQGHKGYIRYGFHSFQHLAGGDETIDSNYISWDGMQFLLNQTWIKQKFTAARDELAYCLGSTGYGFEANKVLVSHAGNEYKTEVDAALFDLDWVYVTYGDNSKNEPGWFLYRDRKNAMTCGGGGERPDEPWRFEALKDAVKTLFPIFGIYAHNLGYYNITFNVYPPDTAYTDMFRFVHLDESYEFYINSRYMHMNTVNAYYKDNKIVLEYKANSNLTDYVWRFPIEHNGKYFNGFSDNRTIGKIKHIDRKYVYIEFSEGGNERLEATYGSNPHIYQTSKYIENITQTYIPKNLTLQLWNSSGGINVKVNCTRLGQPNSVKINGTSIDFNYNLTTKVCSFNVTFNGGLKTVEVTWEHAPPDPPILVSPAQASRFDPSKSPPFTWRFSDPDQDDSQFEYRFQLYNFTTLIIDTGNVTSPSTQTIQTLPNTVALYYWRVKTWDNRGTEGEWSDAQPIIVDKLNIVVKGVTDNRTDIGTSVSVYFDIAREYDNAQFDGTKGTVYINGSAASWDEENKYWKLIVTKNSAGEWKYHVSNITDMEHRITTINNLVGTQEVIWDKPIVTITPNANNATEGTQVNFTVTAVYAYDNKPVSEFTANILRDGAYFATNNFTDTCNIPNTHQYTIESITEKTYDLTAFTSNSPTITWSPKPFSQMLVDWTASNILIIIFIAQTVIILSIIFIRERKTLKKA